MKRKRTYVVVVEPYNDNSETKILEKLIKKVIKGTIKTKHIEIAVNTLVSAIKDAGLDVTSIGNKSITTYHNRISFNTYTDFSAEHC